MSWSTNYSIFPQLVEWKYEEAENRITQVQVHKNCMQVQYLSTCVQINSINASMLDVGLGFISLNIINVIQSLAIHSCLVISQEDTSIRLTMVRHDSTLKPSVFRSLSEIVNALIFSRVTQSHRGSSREQIVNTHNTVMGTYQ